MLFTTTQAHEDFRAKVRKFAEEEIKPIAFKLDRENEFPHEAVKKMAELGFMGLPYDKKYGGAGSDVLSYAPSAPPIIEIAAAALSLNPINIAIK